MIENDPEQKTGRRAFEKKWGIERYVNALGMFSLFLLDNEHPISTEAFLKLKCEHSDAFELCVIHFG